MSSRRWRSFARSADAIATTLMRRLACAPAYRGSVHGRAEPAIEGPYPRNVPDVFSRAQRSRVMAQVRTRGTAPELELVRALRRLGLTGFQRNDRWLPGSPDVAFRRAKVAVFVDGAFWHGHPSKFRFGDSGAFWDAKIATNIARDRRSAARLRRAGWSVLRCWDFDVTRAPDRAAARIARRVRLRVSLRKLASGPNFGKG